LKNQPLTILFCGHKNCLSHRRNNFQLYKAHEILPTPTTKRIFYACACVKIYFIRKLVAPQLENVPSQRMEWVRLNIFLHFKAECATFLLWRKEHDIFQHRNKNVDLHCSRISGSASLWVLCSSRHSITNQQNKSAMMTDHFMGI